MQSSSQEDVTTRWPVDVTVLGRAAGATVAWRWRGQLSVTVVLKATFALVPDAAMTLVDPQPIVRDDEHYLDPSHSLRAAGDLAPHIAQAGVWLMGHAYAPAGQPSSVARLALLRGEQRLIDKSIQVQGDRGPSAAGPEPFQAIPLLYERSVAGPANPIGARGGRAPNFLDPCVPDRPIGFGPLARRWPIRTQLLSGLDPRSLADRIITFPEGFDWCFFQAAPRDQRTAHLTGDDLVVLEGLHPTLPRVTTRLPRARGIARVHGLAPALRGRPEIELRADTLIIDTNRQTGTLLWRGSFPCGREDQLAELHVVAAVELPHQRVAWFDPFARTASRTLSLSLEEIAKRSGPATPFAQVPPVALPVAEARPRAPSAEPPPPDSGVPITARVPLIQRPPPLPWPQRPPPPIAPPPIAPPPIAPPPPPSDGDDGAGFGAQFLVAVAASSARKGLPSPIVERRKQRKGSFRRAPGGTPPSTPRA